MPNWCNNSIKISGDTEQIDEFEKFLNEKNGKDWFDFFYPIPPEYQDGEKWYMWSVENWGCKWNCDANDWKREGDTIEFWFDSPWSPPIALYERMTADGFDIDAYYLEEGMGFVGRYCDGWDDYNEYQLGDPDSLDEISEDIVEFWDLQTRQDDWMAEQELFEDEEEDE